MDSITRAHPTCVGRTDEAAFDAPWYCSSAECQAESPATSTKRQRRDSESVETQDKSDGESDATQHESDSAVSDPDGQQAAQLQAALALEEAEVVAQVIAVAGAQAAAQVVWDGGLWDIDADGHWYYRKRWLGPNVASTFANLSQSQAVALLEGFNRADGVWTFVQFEDDHDRSQPHEPTGSWQCTNSSFPLIDHLQLIAQLAGARVDLTLDVKKGRKSKGPKGRTLTTKVDHWKLAINFRKVYGAKAEWLCKLSKPVDVSNDSDGRGYYEYEDDGHVYDLTVADNHNFLTQRLSLKRHKRMKAPGEAGEGVRAHPVYVGNCSFKANDGHLFFLEKSFFFLKKPPMHIRHAAITSIEFDRLGAANKRFGMKISTSDSKQGEFTFTNIAKDEFDRVVSFMQSKGLHCITTGGEDMQASQAVQQAAAAGRRRAAAVDDFSEDPYMKRLDAAAEEEDAEAAGDQKQQGGDESDSENDEDFTVGSGDSDDSESEASSDDELESEVDESDDEGKKRKKKAGPGKQKAGKKSNKGANDDNGSSDVADGEDGSEKKAAKKSKSAAADKKAAKEKSKPAAVAHSGPTGYQLYAKQNRPLLMIDTPNASFSDISKRIGAKWKAESEDVREEFERKASEARKELQSKQTTAADQSGGTAASDADGDNRGVKRKKPTANTSTDSTQQEKAERKREETKEMEVDEQEERKEGAN